MKCHVFLWNHVIGLHVNKFNNHKNSNNYNDDNNNNDSDDNYDGKSS